MGKPTICIGENKGADQLRCNCEADQRLCFRYSDSTIPPLLNSKFQASSSFLGLYRSVCVAPARKPHCWFSHKTAQISMLSQNFVGSITSLAMSMYDKVCTLKKQSAH